MRTPEFAERIVLAGGAFLVVMAINFADPPRVVSADTSTETPVVGTPTPDALDIQIADSHATITALTKKVELAYLDATKTALSKQIDAIISGTPTEIPELTATQTPIAIDTPTLTSTSTPTLTGEQIGIKKLAGLLPTDTSTPTLTPRPTSAPEKLENKESKEGGGFPWITIPWETAPRVTAAEGIDGFNVVALVALALIKFRRNMMGLVGKGGGWVGGRAADLWRLIKRPRGPAAPDPGTTGGAGTLIS